MHRKKKRAEMQIKERKHGGALPCNYGKVGRVYILTLRVSTEYYTIREKTGARGERGSSTRERSVRRRTAWFCASGFGPRRAARGSSVTRMEEGGSEPHAHGAYKMTRGLRASERTLFTHKTLNFPFLLFLLLLLQVNVPESRAAVEFRAAGSGAVPSSSELGFDATESRTKLDRVEPSHSFRV